MKIIGFMINVYIKNRDTAKGNAVSLFLCRLYWILKRCVYKALN